MDGWIDTNYTVTCPLQHFSYFFFSSALQFNSFLVQMLTRVELMFLHKHSGHLDTTQRSLISHHSSDTTVQEAETMAGDGTQMSRLEKELAKKEQEDRKKSESVKLHVGVVTFYYFLFTVLFLGV